MRNPVRDTSMTARIHTANPRAFVRPAACLLYTSDAADERSSVDLGGRRIIKKKKHKLLHVLTITLSQYNKTTQIHTTNQ